MNAKLKKTFVLFALFVLPALLFYLLVYAGVHKVNRLAFYGPKQIIETKKRGAVVADTIYHSIPPFTAQTTQSIPFSDKSLEGKVYLAHFLDMSQLNDIPKEITYVATQILPTYPSIQFITYLYNFNPNTSLTSPSEKTEKLANDQKRWIYVSLSDSTAQFLQKEGYFKSDEKQAVQDPSSLALVDMEGHIRGYYNPILQSDISNLKKEISLLYKEYELAFKTHKYIEFN